MPSTAITAYGVCIVIEKMAKKDGKNVEFIFPFNLPIRCCGSMRAAYTTGTLIWPLHGRALNATSATELPTSLLSISIFISNSFPSGPLQIFSSDSEWASYSPFHCFFFFLFFLPRSIASFMQSCIIICSIHVSFITIITTARITHVDFVHTTLHKPFAVNRFSPVFGKLKRLRCNYFI